MVQRKRPQVMVERWIGSDYNPLGCIIGTKHTKAVLEKQFGIEIGRKSKCFIRFFEEFDTVQCIDGGMFPFVVIGQQIPPLSEHFNGIGFDGYGVARGLVELAVGHLQFAVQLHGIDDGLQVFFPQRYVFENDALFQRTAFHKHVADGERIEHPLLEIVVGKYLLVFDVIEISAFALALDGDIEHFFNGDAVPVEGDAVHGHTATHFRPYPSVVQLL